MDIPERRQFKRLKVNLPVTYEQLGIPGRNYGETVTRDISVTGMRMNMKAFFPTNSTFLIKLLFPEVNKIVESTSRVAWAHRISYSDQYQVGLEFSEMNPMFRKWLQEYILINETLAK